MVPDSTPVRTSGSAPETSDARDAPTDGDRSSTGRDDRSATRGHAAADATAEDAHACPLCGFTHERRETVYTHLVLGHRKQAISSALLEAQSTSME